MEIGTSHRLMLLAGTLLAGTAIIGLAQAAETTYVGYHVTKVQVLPGKNPGWDHVTIDPVNRHVFIGRRALGVAVVNIDTGEISEVKDTKGTNGAWPIPELGIGLSDNGKENDVTVFDLKTLAVKGKIKVPKETDGVWYDPATKQAFVSNGDEGSITLVDPVAMKAGDTIDLNSKKPEFASVDGKGRAFIPFQDKNQLGVVDLKTKKVATTWPVDCIQPTSTLYEAGTDRIFVACRGAKPLLVVVDATTGKGVYSFPIGSNVDAVTFNPVEKLIMTSNGDAGTISVFKQDSKDAYHLVEEVATRLGARTMVVDPKTQKAFTVTADFVWPAQPAGAARRPPKKYISDTFTLLTLERGTIE
jgi:DNA-binding beta-propeller fold protein YncE